MENNPTEVTGAANNAPQQTTTSVNPASVAQQPATGGTVLSQPPQPNATAPMQQQVPPQQPAKSTKKFYVILGSALTALLIVLFVAILAWFLWLSPLAQSKRASTAFMKALTANDTEKVFELTDTTDEAGKAFITNAAKKSEGTFKLKSQTMKDGAGYFLYNLSNPEGKMGRTTVKKDKGKYTVTSYVFGSDSLALVPGVANDIVQPDDTSSSTPTPSSTANTAVPTACLTQVDYKWFNYNKEPDSVTYDTTYSPGGATFNKIGQMFFNPDSTQESSLSSVYDDWADFASKNADKQWTFRLEGSTYGSDAAAASSKQLANARSEEVKRELVSRGVPESRITIDAPRDYGTETQDDSVDQIYRRVTVTIDPTCTGSTSSGSNR